LFTHKTIFFMKKDNIFRATLLCLSELTGIPQQLILSDTHEDASDARYVLVSILSPLLTDADLASRLCRTPQGVGHIRRNPKKPSKWIVQRNLQELRKRFESILSPPS
jgi:hypothetical protein